MNFAILSVRSFLPRLLAVCVFAAAFTPAALFAQDDAASEATRWGFYFNLGAGGMSGDFADQLQKGTTGEFGLHKETGHWRYGLGLSFGSWGMTAPYDHELEWGFQRIDVSATRIFRENETLRPYLQGRFGIVRLHPRSELFNMDPLPEDYEVGDSPTEASNGVHLGLMPGLEWKLTRTVSLDLSLLLDYFMVGETDLSPIGGGNASSGFDWQARLGVMWWNDGGPGSTPAPLDPWGVRPSYGWAVGEALAINFGASAFNEYVRNANFNQISPRSWYENLKDGLTYDDNQFKTNQLIHPFNGSQYYNAARANGISYWPSYGIGIVGAVHWELMGETHPMSFNDIISTGIGGAAMGETMYRMSSMLLDNEKSGMGRFWREAGGFLVDPVRGFNRILSGQAWKVYENPDDHMDRRPDGSVHDLAVGWRRSGNGDYPSLEHDYTDYMWFRYLHEHGNVFDNTRNGPWDYFDLDARLSWGDKNTLTRLMIVGNWKSVAVGDAPVANHRIGFTQHFEYINTNAYEFGGQSFGVAAFSRWRESGNVSFDTRADLMGTLLGAVNSDYSDSLAVVANQERFREYDYGPGAGAQVAVAVGYRGEPIFSAGYRVHFLYVTNGSIYSGEEVGLDARHWLHAVELRLETPTVRRFGAGVEYSSFTRESHYKIRSNALPQNITATQLLTGVTPEFHLYLHFSPGAKKKSS